MIYEISRFNLSLVDSQLKLRVIVNIVDMVEYVEYLQGEPLNCRMWHKYKPELQQERNTWRNNNFTRFFSIGQSEIH
jgi:L-arabinose isomerase